MRPIRSPSSEELDDQTIRRRGGEIVTIPSALPWAQVYSTLERRWQVGQHFALIARTRSGKTTFAREILDIRDYVVVFGTKPKDEELYAGFERKGYVIKDEWSPDDLDDRRVIFRPPSSGLLDIGPQKRAFAQAMDAVYEVGGWTVYIDEMLVLAKDLGLEAQINRLYTQAASNDVTIVAGTQRPRGIPMNMLDQSEWFGLWRIPDLEDRDRAGEVMGAMRGLAVETMKVIPRYEVLVVNPIEDEAWRTKVNV